MKRCVYILDNGHQCRKAGYGSPPLCHLHDEDEIDDVQFGPDTLKSFMDSVKEAIGQFGQILGQVQGQPPLSPRAPRAPSQPQQPRQEDPRVILGFPPDAKLTPEIVKQRRKDLANLFHPDHGGSVEAMRRVNMAADALLASLK